ncbi:hypothetical protein [Dyadobacter sp. 32]|uniref:hypothetical protein n=1 Tax=Dyadobacter sp. 32 TaxID=538966 RepID=UPI0011ED7A41
MKSLLYILIVVFSMISCKSGDEGFPFSTSVETIVGQWRLVAEEQGFVGQSLWASVKQDSTYDVIFRNDGVILNHKGLPACCAPKSLTINGAFYEIKPTSPLASNPDCASINCGNCLIWDIQISGNEMILASCNSLRRRYLRK